MATLLNLVIYIHLGTGGYLIDILNVPPLLTGQRKSHKERSNKLFAYFAIILQFLIKVRLPFLQNRSTYSFLEWITKLPFLTDVVCRYQNIQ